MDDIKPYDVELVNHCCDDTTTLHLDLTEEEAILIGRLTDWFSDEADTHCQPYMRFKKL